MVSAGWAWPALSKQRNGMKTKKKKKTFLSVQGTTQLTIGLVNQQQQNERFQQLVTTWRRSVPAYAYTSRAQLSTDGSESSGQIFKFPERDSIGMTTPQTHQLTSDKMALFLSELQGERRKSIFDGRLLYFYTFYVF